MHVQFTRRGKSRFAGEDSNGVATTLGGPEVLAWLRRHIDVDRLLSVSAYVTPPPETDHPKTGRPHHTPAKFQQLLKLAAERIELAQTYLEDGALLTAAGIFSEASDLIARANQVRNTMLGIEAPAPTPEQPVPIASAKAATKKKGKR
jgi:hypothetical protein